MKRLDILITAGPTREYIDPVRFISNPSTGKMGYEIAQESARRRHKTILISGPTYLRPPKGVRFISVISAIDMNKEVKKYFPHTGVLIMCAAVSDYRVKRYSLTKIKRGKTVELNLKMVRNPDIIKEVQRHTYKLKHTLGAKMQSVVGFALETEDVEKNARQKLKEKKLDMIVASKVSKDTNPFGDIKTEVSVFTKNGEKYRLKGSKKKIAKILLDKIENM